MIPRILPLAILTVLATACSSPVTPPPPPAPWAPSTVYRTPAGANARGLLDRRGLIHAHSVHSHDACDGRPRDDAGVYDAVCNADFRRGLCQVQHDFVFLTDHRGSFDETEFPDTLLYDAALGDVLVTHEGLSTASWLNCPDAGPALVMAGAETNSMMPIGIEEHVGPAATRGSVYGDDQPASYLAVKQKNAVMLVAHTEGWTVDQLATLPLDGFEMYNLHANSLVNAGTVADLSFQIDRKEFDGLPHPDLFLTAYTKFEDARYLETWGSVLARGVHRFGTVGTDCHRNTFPALMQDGERIDSYRRMMKSFSNHVLVTPGADGGWDDRSLKDALRAGRSYGAFDYLGYPEGFDATALEGGVVREMGDTVSLAKTVTLTVTMPKVQQLDPLATAPLLKAQWLVARDGGWDVVAEGPGPTLEATPTRPGAYRAEIRITPRHLTAHIGKRRDFIKNERPWVYGNPVYVVP
ncbi:MAG: uncharacterized protein H6Q89_1418 [Myxococcaceae bacterium]|nr:uncharacterized protein [Myxococcaceae bacterium]